MASKIAPFIVLLLSCSLVRSEQSLSEREAVLNALALSYGEAIDRDDGFALKADYILKPDFSADGLLIEISIQPKGGREAYHPAHLLRAEFESVLANINSIKPLGGFEEDFAGTFISGGRAWTSHRYQNAYLRTQELLSYDRPLPIESARLYYLHPVTGIAALPRDVNPANASSFGLVCVDGEAYIAPKEEFLGLWSAPNERQTVELAGPTEDSCAGFSPSSPDAVLYKRGLAAMKRKKFSVANISFQTLVNTYPNSPYASRAMRLLKLPRIANCGQPWNSPADCDAIGDNNDRTHLINDAQLH